MPSSRAPCTQCTPRSWSCAPQQLVPVPSSCTLYTHKHQRGSSDPQVPPNTAPTGCQGQNIGHPKNGFGVLCSYPEPGISPQGPLPSSSSLGGPVPLPLALAGLGAPQTSPLGLWEGGAPQPCSPVTPRCAHSSPRRPAALGQGRQEAQARLQVLLAVRSSDECIALAATRLAAGDHHLP